MYVPGLFEDPAEAQKRALAQAQAYAGSLPPEAPKPSFWDRALNETSIGLTGPAAAAAVPLAQEMLGQKQPQKAKPDA